MNKRVESLFAIFLVVVELTVSFLGNNMRSEYEAKVLSILMDK